MSSRRFAVVAWTPPSPSSLSMDREAYIHLSELSNGKRVIYDKRNPEETFVEYVPPEDNMKRYYNSP